MKITPVKNYKKPRYAAALAAVTALSAVSGCVTATPGSVSVGDDTTTTTELLIDGGVQLETDVTTAVPEGTVITTTEEEPADGTVTQVSVPEEVLELAGDVAFVPDETENYETTTDETEIVTEITTSESVEIDGGIVIPEDEEMPVAEEFSLAGDIAVAPDYEAEIEGMGYDTEYINTFYDKKVPLMRWVYDDADWRTGMTLGEIPFVVSLQSTRDDFFISFYSSDNSDLCAEIETAGGVPFDYGYIVYAAYKGGERNLVFIDVNRPHYDNIGKIVDYLISEGIALQYVEETADDPTKAVFQEFVTDGIAALPEDETYEEFTEAGEVALPDDEIYEEFTLEGDVAVAADEIAAQYNYNEPFFNSYTAGMAYDEEYLSAFIRHKMEFAIIDTGYVIYESENVIIENIPTAFEGISHKLVIVFYSEEDNISALLEKGGAKKTDYGFLGQVNYYDGKRKIAFINIDNNHSKNIAKTAEAIAAEEIDKL